MSSPPQDKRTLRVFLCHASPDKNVVRRLYQRLRRAGMTPWLDETDILPGAHWESTIHNAIRTSDVVLVCISRNFRNKEGFVQKEIKYVLDVAAEKPDGSVYLIPVKIEDCAVPESMSRYQWADIESDAGYKRLFTALGQRAKDVGAELPGRTRGRAARLQSTLTGRSNWEANLDVESSPLTGDADLAVSIFREHVSPDAEQQDVFPQSPVSKHELRQQPVPEKERMLTYQVKEAYGENRLHFGIPHVPNRGGYDPMPRHYEKWLTILTKGMDIRIDESEVRSDTKYLTVYHQGGSLKLDRSTVLRIIDEKVFI